MNIIKKSISGVVLSVVALGFTLSATAQAEVNPFAEQVTVNFVKEDAAHKCGEGKCGESKAKSAKAGKCGEGKCGESKAKSAKAGKCGEGKCGESKAKK